MMDPKRLWAKSKRDDHPEHPSMLLPGHLADVYHAAERVLDATADDQLKALGLDPEVYRGRFRRIVLLAAAVHDLGKANDHFQGMVQGTRNVQQNPQGLRHEWATILMLAKLRESLLPAVDGDESDFAIVAWTVAGHHTTSRPSGPPEQGGHGPSLVLLTSHKDFAASLDWIKTRFSLATIPLLPDITYELVGSNRVFDVELKRWDRDSQRPWERMRVKNDARLVAAAKNCLIAADVAGSALPKAKPSDVERWNWITKAFADKPEPGDLQAVVDFRLGGNTPRPFQVAVSESTTPVTYVKAGCGTGKTLAAYMWAAKNHPTRRLYFCYPTTGTATEGFRDYLFDEAEKTPRVGADLFHGRSDIDFDIILNTGPDGRSLSEEEARLDSLRAWKTPVVACTVDTVLGIVQNNRRGLFAWPALAQSAFVFDEIHAFDDRLFGALLRFLRDVPGLPVLLMTASLPQAREEALRAVLATLGREFHPIPGPATLEELPRYHRIMVADNDPLASVEEAIRLEGKVLWVGNTVGRVMDAAQRTSALNPLIYHSRFKYVHRVERHKAVIEAFRGKGAALAICSQVAEMSLDLSADLLVTDLAPVPALIQRLGRLNRRAKEDDPTRPFVVVQPDNPLPYTPSDLDASVSWLAKLPPANISQRDLADSWEQAGDHPPELVASAWLDGGPVTTVSELREASPGITVLMQEDFGRVRTNSRNLRRYVLPMPPPPRQFGWKAWPRVLGIPVAPAGTILYDEVRGAEWAK